MPNHGSKYFFISILLAGWAPLVFGDMLSRPFEIGGGIGGNFDQKNGSFSASHCVKAKDKPLDHVKLEMRLPPELVLQEGELTWEGTVAPREEKCVKGEFLATTNRSDWSGPWIDLVEVTIEKVRYKLSGKRFADGESGGTSLVPVEYPGYKMEDQSIFTNDRLWDEQGMTDTEVKEYRRAKREQVQSLE